MKANYLFIASAALLIINAAITVADWLHGGPMWPWLIVGVGLEAAALPWAAK